MSSKPNLELKNTLNLPRTSFPMKAELPSAEPGWLERWQRGRLYRKLRQARRSSPVFVLHDGPPYANGDVHLGTALNKILKDLIVKTKSMAGFNTAFIPGWDCHGLPIEINVDRELGARKKGLGVLEIRQACRAYAQRFLELQRSTFMRLGCFGQWEEPYLTMSNEYEFVIADTFLTFLEKGYVYRGKKPVLWCWHDQTALAEAEIEYEMRTSPSIWVRYPVVAPPGRGHPEAPSDFPAGTYAVIWTTTPWTLPASLALAFHPQLRYAVVERTGGERYLVAEDLVTRFREEMKRSGDQFGDPLGSWRGEELKALEFRHPFLDRTLPAVLADYVTLEQGSGIVHTAPGHGAEDFETGQQYGLEAYCPVDEAGRFTEGPFQGESIWDANPKIVERLRQEGNLVGDAGTLEHSYPHCWRCHQPLLFRATEQWFIRLEHRQLRQRALGEIRKVRWVPSWGEERISAMIETRPDWCISRQRVWGVPIPVFYCEGCHEPFLDAPTLRTVVAWFKREGADAWFRHSADDLLPKGTRCESCGGTRFRQESDILDVWFDSGTSHLAVLRAESRAAREPENRWPADLYVEGNDQYRGWFHSSLLIAVGAKDAAPYRGVVTHGWVLDSEGRPMSKSLGNVIAPREVWERYGAEILRVVTASVEYQGDLRIGTRLLEQTAEAYRKVRNTFRFCLSNLYDFDPGRDAVPVERMEGLDRWMLNQTAELVAACRRAYDDYAFHRVWHRLYNFCVVDLSAFYFDVLKDRLYTFAPHSLSRRSAQTVLYRMADALTRLLAPVLSFTAEEVWSHLPATAGGPAEPGRPESVHLALFPSAAELDARLPAAERQAWQTLLSVRTEVLKALERARQTKTIRSSLEAQVHLRADGELSELLTRYLGELAALFIVSHGQVKLIPVRDTAAKLEPSDFPGLTIAVCPAEGKKCERCWNYSSQIGRFDSYPTVCERCGPVLELLARSSPGGAPLRGQP